jgi:hypothetical protein
MNCCNTIKVRLLPPFAILIALLTMLIFNSCKRNSNPINSENLSGAIKDEVEAFNAKYQGIEINDLGLKVKSKQESEILSKSKFHLILFRSLNSCPNCNFDAEDVLQRVHQLHPGLSVQEYFFVQNQHVFDRLSSRLAIPKSGLILSLKYRELEAKPFFAFTRTDGKFMELLPLNMEKIDVYTKLIEDLIKYKMSSQ